MKIEVDLQNYKPVENDVIIFKNGKWINTRIDSFLYEMKLSVGELKERVEKLENDIKEIKGE